jgi:hypothetical protein
MRGALVGLTLAGIAVTGVLPVAAAVKIDRVQYDSPGSDTGSNTSLNAEYVVIKNTGP